MASNSHTQIDYNDLANEAIAFHKTIFKSKPTQEIVKKYVEAHNTYINDASNNDKLWLKRALNLELDFEALEVALRLTNEEHILVRKMKILLYITESYPLYYSRFVNDRPQRLKAFLSLCYYSLRSVYKLIKGIFLLLFYRNGVNDNV